MSEIKKLENCEVCGGEKAKYTCPKCEVRTCSISCVNIHKKELECDGIRDKTKFIPLQSFTDLDLLSDYRLLEEIGRSVDKSQRDKTRKFTSEGNLPPHLFKLKQTVSKYNIRLDFLPQHFTRHYENSTFLNWKTGDLFWKIEWIFPQAQNTRWITKKALDTTRLADLVEAVLNPEIPQNDEEEAAKVFLLKNRLEFYSAAGLSGLKILLKAEKVEKSGSKFYEIDLTMSLRENLKKKTIIENPIIYVLLKDHSHMFEVLQSDEEDEPETKQMTSVNQQNHSKTPFNSSKNFNKEKEMVNYFFDYNSESESEEKPAVSTKKSL